LLFPTVSFFFIFLPLTLALCFAAPTRFRNMVLLVASFIFYIWGAGWFVLILLANMSVDYFAGIFIAYARSNGLDRFIPWAVRISVITNLAMLGVYKYGQFAIIEFNHLLSWMGQDGLNVPNIILPIGISFFTFQSMSYSIDVGRGKVKHLANPIDFALFVTLFPQLVAGPIVRYHEISQQIKERSYSWERFGSGSMRFAHGFIKKVLVADAAAQIANQAFAVSNGEQTFLTVWIGIVAYATQLYFDFSGYSDMAIGLGTMLGFDFPENFNRPFSAYSITDHWRRWHITLSNWFRDYVYIPLGGSRGSTAKTYRNLFAVFIGMGVWHGAAWHYLFFGLYQGIFLSTEKLFEWRAVDGRPAHPAFRRALALFIVLVGYVIFRAESMGQAGAMLSAMFQPWNWELHRTVLWGLPGRATLATLVGFATFFLPRNLTFGPMVAGPRNDRFANGYRLLLMLALFPYALAIMSAGTFSPFIYFQF